MRRSCFQRAHHRARNLQGIQRNNRSRHRSWLPKIHLSCNCRILQMKCTRHQGLPNPWSPTEREDNKVNVRSLQLSPKKQLTIRKCQGPTMRTPTSHSSDCVYVPATHTAKRPNLIC